MTESIRSLRSGFLDSCEQFPDRAALEVAGESLTYRQLREKASTLAATLKRHVAGNDPPLAAVLGHRSADAFAAVLGALLRGHGYVPLHPAFPPRRNRTMLARAGCRSLIVDAFGEGSLGQLLAGFERPLVILLPHHRDITRWKAAWPQHTFLGAGDLESGESLVPEPADPGGIAYLLFTSGSTGIPKGVMVSHRNVTRFIDLMVQRYSIRPEDRFSQIFELVFDLSVFDMFVAWQQGACVCCPSKEQLLIPSHFIQQSQITIWFSVPSTALLMKRLGMLAPGEFPSLRVSLFCGEALPAEVTEAWAAAAANSIVENLYGPTEVTLCCTAYRWDANGSRSLCENGIVPIGDPLPGMKALVVGDDFVEVAPGETGELLMAGPQVALGYLNDPEKTAQSFVVPPGRTEVHYRTGDQVRRPRDGEPLRYLGRLDHQVQIHGYRVELGEIEAALRDAAGVDVAVAMGWPASESGADGVVAFVEAASVDVAAVKNQLKSRLPHYMVPRDIHAVPTLPLNSNGKIDRKALTDLLDPVSCAASH